MVTDFCDTYTQSCSAGGKADPAVRRILIYSHIVRSLRQLLLNYDAPRIACPRPTRTSHKLRANWMLHLFSGEKNVAAGNYSSSHRRRT